MACENASTQVNSDSQGRAWEHFFLDKQYIFSNQIPNLQSWTRTDPGWVLNDNSYCQWAGTPPPRMRETLPQGVTTTQALANEPIQAATNEGMTSGGFGLLVLLAAGAAGVWYWMNRGKEPDPSYQPFGDLDLSLPRLGPSASTSPPDEIWIGAGDTIPPGYVLVDDEGSQGGRDEHPKAQGNSIHGIPSIEPCEFAGNSHEFEGNSQNDESANSPGIPQVSADSHDWPPKDMGAPCDPLQPEQDGEFDCYRRAVEKDGLNPRGNDIIKQVWGVTPGRSSAYQAAKTRRDEFAKRLDYYRYEGA